MIARVASLIAGLLVTLGLAWLGYHSSEPDLGKGALVGGCLALAFIGISLAVGRRGAFPIRVASGVGDERDLAITHRALAHAAVAMTMTSGAWIIGAPNARATVVGGTVIVAGTLAAITSYLICSRRA